MRLTNLIVCLTSCACLLSAQRTLEAGAPVTALPDSSKRWALLIGVDEYEDRSITSLHGAANDARSLKKTLVSYGGFRDDQTVVLATGEPAERRPTRTNILAYLANLAAATPKDGMLLIGFSGHGIERNGRAFLLPADARLSNDAEFLEDVSVSVNRMRQRIRQAGVQQVVVLLDACRNDPGGRADAPNPLTAAFARGFQFDVRNREVNAFATLYATKIGERAWEYNEKKRGYFSWALEEALTGKAANGRGEVTLGAVIRYVQERVPKQVAIDLGSGRNQLPFAELGGYRADDLVLSVVAPPRTAVVSYIDARAWDEVKDSQSISVLEEFRKQFPDSPYARQAAVRLAALRVRVSPPEPARVETPGKRVNPKDGLTYVYVPPGWFMMGCSPGDSECYGHEKPAKRTTISNGFYLSETEVTQSAYKKVGDTTPGILQDANANPSYFKGADLPVEQVTWIHANEYCRLIGGRLPTAAEWEYAARAGTTGSRYGELGKIAWYDGNSNGRTHPVRQKEPNAWGLYDMLGNVWEWVNEDYPGSGKEMRGGATGNSRSIRASYRSKAEPSYSYRGIGFRCAWE